MRRHIKVHAGCGENLVDGWTNIDYYPYFYSKRIIAYLLMNIGLYPKKLFHMKYERREECNVYLNWNLKKLLPFQNDSVDYIYSEHFVEHLEYEDALKFFKESIRILGKGGIIRISVPDLRSWAKHYLDNNIDFFMENLQIDAQKKGENLSRDKTQLNDILREIKTIGELYSYHLYRFHHKWGYDYGNLEKVLKDIGFRHIKKREFHESDIPDIQRIEQEGRSGDSLYVESMK